MNGMLGLWGPWVWCVCALQRLTPTWALLFLLRFLLWRATAIPSYSHGEWWWFFEGEWWLYVRHTVRPACCYVRLTSFVSHAKCTLQAFARSGMGIETGAWYPWSPMGVDTAARVPRVPPTRWCRVGIRRTALQAIHSLIYAYSWIHAHVAQNAAGVQNSLHGKERSWPRCVGRCTGLLRTIISCASWKCGWARQLLSQKTFSLAGGGVFHPAPPCTQHIKKAEKSFIWIKNALKYIKIQKNT